ncbi:unnamed protein product [Effrenium voratum]|uniref:Uncharacterized protein n=1 Tax=Effrenium voratum TaxID=2562239 RepID=A0AA36JG13_9DINO|nr:unnamed protein product [Effrenium voratum]
MSTWRVRLRALSQRWMSACRRSCPEPVVFPPPEGLAVLELELTHAQAMSRMILTCHLRADSESLVSRLDWVPAYYAPRKRNRQVVHALDYEDADTVWRTASRFFAMEPEGASCGELRLDLSESSKKCKVDTEQAKALQLLLDPRWNPRLSPPKSDLPTESAMFDPP